MLNEDAVGLLFAGSAYALVLNHIFYVQSLLNIHIHK